MKEALLDLLVNFMLVFLGITLALGYENLPNWQLYLSITIMCILAGTKAASSYFGNKVIESGRTFIETQDEVIESQHALIKTHRDIITGQALQIKEDSRFFKQHLETIKEARHIIDLHSNKLN